MKNCSAVLLILLCIIFQVCPAQDICKWESDVNGFPKITYTGNFPLVDSFHSKFVHYDRSDPYTILGNHRFTMFAHKSGYFQLLATDRVWGRLNKGSKDNSGYNGASIQINNGQVVSLVDSAGTLQNKFEFGVGYAQYSYQPEKDVYCDRILSVMPSVKIGKGPQGFYLTVTITNKSKKEISIEYKEFVQASFDINYQQNFWGNGNERRKQNFNSEIVNSKGMIYSVFKPQITDPLIPLENTSVSYYENSPPSLILFSFEDSKVDLFTEVDGKNRKLLGFKKVLKLNPGQRAQLRVFIGMSYQYDTPHLEQLKGVLTTSYDPKDPVFSKSWKTILPEFANESNVSIRNEMIWNAYVLEAMLTYSEYFEEVYLPSGTNYDYHWGIHVCVRDQAQGILPFCYYRPEIVKATIRFLMKKMHNDGLLHNDDLGYGVVSSRMFTQSDNQLYFMWLVSEYISITKDIAVLSEVANFYPKTNTSSTSVLDRLLICHNYITNEIGVGPHGIIRMLNSDWNDDFYFTLNPAPFNISWLEGESMVNSGMLIMTYKKLIDGINENIHKVVSGDDVLKIKKLINYLEYSRAQQLSVYQNDAQKGKFVKRGYFLKNRPFGDSVVWLQPQAFALMIPELSKEYKYSCIQSVEKSLKEKVGFRVRQDFQLIGHYATPGSGENGAIWFVPLHQYILGLIQIDREKAQRLYEETLFYNISSKYPDRWVGAWTSSDYIISSLSKDEGYSYNLPFCSLPHAYKVFNYYKLHEN